MASVAWYGNSLVARTIAKERLLTFSQSSSIVVEACCKATTTEASIVAGFVSSWRTGSSLRKAPETLRTNGTGFLRIRSRRPSASSRRTAETMKRRMMTTV